MFSSTSIFKNNVFAGLLLFSASVIPAARLSAQDALYLELSSQGQRLDLGLADFSTQRPKAEDAAMARRMRDVVRNDLLFPRIFNMIEGGAAPLRGKVNFKSWQGLNADVLVTGYVNAAQYGRFEFIGTLYDVESGQVILEKRYLSEPENERRVAHQWADEVVRHFLGVPGIASSRFYFINDATGKKEVCSVDYDGENFRKLTNDRSIALFPKVSPDGRWVIFTSFRDGKPDIHIMKSDGSDRRPLAKYAGLNSAAAWLPDGNSVVATLSYEGGPNLYHIDLTGRVLRVLTNTPSIQTAPSLSPDGRKLVFTSDRPGKPQIYTMDFSGANLKRFSHDGTCDSPAWSPQGNLVAFAMTQPGMRGYDIYTIEVASGYQKRLTFGEGSNENPAWSPDGRYLAFTSSRRGKPELWVMGFDGSSPRPVGNIPGRSFTPSWGY